MYLCIYTFMFIYVYISIYIYISTHIWLYILSEKVITKMGHNLTHSNDQHTICLFNRYAFSQGNMITCFCVCV